MSISTFPFAHHFRVTHSIKNPCGDFGLWWGKTRVHAGKGIKSLYSKGERVSAFGLVKELTLEFSDPAYKRVVKFGDPPQTCRPLPSLS